MENSKQTNPKRDLELLRQALARNKNARQILNQQIDSIISYQSQRLCKRFCHDNRYLYSCSLPYKPYASAKDTPLCEWGNACYGWILEELTSDKRLSGFKAENNASFNHYCYMIANSKPFYERWKNWRFSRRTYIPAYISEIDERSSAVFLALQKGDEPALIAQNLQISELDVQNISRRIVVELTTRKRLYLLDPPSTVSLSADDEHETEVAFHDEPAESQEQKHILVESWSRLSALEQFVLESLLIDKLDAIDVLQVIEQQQQDFPDEELKKIHNRQSLYYFRRKSLDKLSHIFKEQRS